MIHHRTRSQVRRLDWLKAIVALGLTTLLAVLLLQLPAGAVPEENAAAPTPAAAAGSSGPAAANEGGTVADNAVEEGAAANETAAAVEDDATDDAAAGAPLFRSVALPEIPAGGLTPGVYAFSGGAAPGSRIQLRDGGRLLGEAVAAADGSWDIDAPLDATVTNLSLEATAPDGVQTEQYRDNRLAGLTVRWPAPRLSGPNGKAVDDSADAGSFTLSGVGVPGTEVALLLNDAEVATTTVNADGAWSADLLLDEPGTFSLAARSGAATSDPLTVTLLPELAAPVVQATTGPENGGPGTYTFTGSATPAPPSPWC